MHCTVMLDIPEDLAMVEVTPVHLVGGNVHI